MKEINALEIVRQRHINLILLLTFILSMIVSAFLFYLQYKRKEEMKRLLQQESDRLKQENKLLKQAEELSVLREILNGGRRAYRVRSRSPRR